MAQLLRARATAGDRALLAPLLVAGGTLVVSVALHVRDPHQQGAWGLCPWLFLTGTYCPGCGGLRAVHDLTDGDLVAAASSNLLVVLAAPVAVMQWARWTQRRWRGRAWPVPARPLLWILTPTAIAVVFAVLRNLPAGAWLAP